MFYIYILSSQNNNVLYVGVTNDLKRRVIEHKKAIVDGFTKKYHVNKLVYYETFSTSMEAIRREKQLKGWIRNKKIALINSMNPEWEDLFDKLP